MQEPTAQLMRKNISRAKPFLAQGEGYEHVFVPYRLDVFNFLEGAITTHLTYDVTWSGNLLHLFTPAQVKVYLANLYEITNPGGYAFATVNAPSCNIEIIRYYEELQQKGEEFPGYIQLNKIIYRSYNTRTKQQYNHHVDIVGPIIKAANGSVPNLEMNGFHNEPSTTQIAWEFHGMVSDFEGLNKRKCHTSMQFFDTKVLAKLFEDAGFVVEDVYYMDESSNQFSRNTPLSKLVDRFYNAGIVAKKIVKPNVEIKYTETSLP
jgi:hypothetical protein